MFIWMVPRRFAVRDSARGRAAVSYGAGARRGAFFIAGFHAAAVVLMLPSTGGVHEDEKRVDMQQHGGAERRMMPDEVALP